MYPIYNSKDSNVSNKDFNFNNNFFFTPKGKQKYTAIGAGLSSKNQAFLSFQIVYQIAAGMVHYHFCCSFDMPFLYQLLKKSVLHLCIVQWMPGKLKNRIHNFRTTRHAKTGGLYVRLNSTQVLAHNWRQRRVQNLNFMGSILRLLALNPLHF